MRSLFVTSVSIQFETEADHGGPDMNWLPRSLVLPGAIAVIFVAGAAFVVSAHDGTTLEPDICSTAGAADCAEAPFLAENEAAMTKMMKGMAARPSGDVDADFVAMINAIGPIRQIVRGEDKIPRRYLVIAPGTVANFGEAVQVQLE
jgi:hypothetical protein